MDSPDLQRLLADRPMMAMLLSYWDERRKGRAMPDRADIDPIALDPQLLPHLTLYDLFDGGRRARVRLIGTHLTPAFGTANPTGRFVDELLPPAQLQYFSSIMVELCRERCPIYSIDRHASFERGHIHSHRLILPLAHGGDDIAMSLGITLYIPTAEPFVPPARLLYEIRPSSEYGERTELARYRIRDGMVEASDPV